jgi:chromate transport protein ChrA
MMLARYVFQFSDIGAGPLVNTTVMVVPSPFVVLVVAAEATKVSDNDNVVNKVIVISVKVLLLAMIFILPVFSFFLDFLFFWLGYSRRV